MTKQKESTTLMKTAEDNSYSANLEKARRITTDCLKQKKVYCIQGCYPVVRRMLEKYDYVEKDWRHSSAQWLIIIEKYNQ